MIQKTCFLDMDGVLSDFVSSACRLHDRANPYQHPENHGVWEVDRLFSLPPRDFYRGMDYDYWCGMDRLTDGCTIYEGCCATFGHDNVFILSSPTRNWGCLEGKRAWLVRHFPFHARSAIFTPSKHAIAGRHKVLVDDSDGNVNDWRAAGGEAVHVPRLWNSRHKLHREAGPIALAEMRAICGKE